MTLYPSHATHETSPAGVSWNLFRHIRSRLFRKYVLLFVAVVSIALITNGILEIFFSYQEHKETQTRIQREQAEAAAAKIGQFIKEIEGQIGWTTQLDRKSVV